MVIVVVFKFMKDVFEDFYENSITCNLKIILGILNVSSAFYTTGLIKDLHILKKGRV